MIVVTLKVRHLFALNPSLHSRNLGSQTSDAKSETESVSQVDNIVTLLHQYPENATADYTSALTPDELLYIGFQSAQLIYDSNTQHLEDRDTASAHDPLNALNTLKQLSQNFPKYASTLARRVVIDENLQAELFQNNMKVQGGANAVWLNGVVVQEKDMNPFSYADIMTSPVLFA